MINAAFLIYDRVLFSGVTRPYEILKAVNAMAKMDREGRQLELSLVKIVDEQPQVAGEIPLNIEEKLQNLGHMDWIFIPPSWRNPAYILNKYPHLPALLKERYEAGTKFIATGAGVYFLAEAGLLDDCPATTHWYFFDDFEKRYPKIELKRQHFITYGHGIYCAGSINALSDLVFHLIGQAFGLKHRQMAERHFEHEVGSSYDLPMFSIGNAAHADESIIEVQEWLKISCHEEIDIPQMAKKAEMPVRTFTRRFRQALGMTPNQYLQDLRIENGRDLLKTTDLTVQDVAENVGYKDTAYFSRVFKTKVGLTPTDYKKMVRPKLFQLSQNNENA
ncbi:MAG: transcriptional regulator GlxA family with amidase domain [Oleiphilaceae bacterium]|jgi:transcriptional regulator GlxA family with amidase domain